MDVKPLAKDVDRSALIHPQETALVIVDEQAVRRSLRDETVRWRGRPYEPVAELAFLFNVPCIVYLTVGDLADGPVRKSGGNRPADLAIVSTRINPWREPAFAEAVEAVGRPKLLVSGYCANAGATFAVLDALLRGFDVSYVADATAGRDCIETRLAIQRMIQAGAVPLSWQQLAYEWQADWSNEITRHRVLELVGP